MPARRIVAPPVDKLYADFAKEKGFQPETLVLSNGTKAYWINNKNAEKVVVWFHGVFTFFHLEFSMKLNR